MKFKYKNITADAGYESEENYLFLEANGQLSYIKPANYEISKTRKYKNDIGKIENMEYDVKKISIPVEMVKIRCRSYPPLKKQNRICKRKTIYKVRTVMDALKKANASKGIIAKTPLEERTKTLQVAKIFLKT